MLAEIRGSELAGIIRISASKSAMQRACGLALLRRGETFISNAGKSDDELQAIRVIQDLGAVVTQQGEGLKIDARVAQPKRKEINCGESGLGIRLFSAIGATFSEPLVFTGRGSLTKRRLDFLELPFAQLNAHYKTTAGHFPIEVRGPIKPTSITLPVLPGSQYLTALLFVLAATAKERLTLSVSEPLVSRPYIDLSLDILRHFHFQVQNDSYEKFTILPSQNGSKMMHYSVESDWSSAAFLIVAATLAGDLTLTGLNPNSSQGDKVILDVIKSANVSYDTGTNIVVRKCNSLKAFEFDATNYPDLFPPLTALAIHCEGETVISGVSRLFNKESNRAESLVDVFSQMGAEIKCIGNKMLIRGTKHLSDATVSSHSDHRIVMSCAVAALRGNSIVRITGAEAVSKSYPSFFDQLRMLGGNVSLLPEPR